MKHLATRKGLSWIVVLALFLMFISPIVKPNVIKADASWYNADWSYRKAITIDHTKVSGSSDLSNFPILVNLASDSDLASHAQDDGDDILFTSSDGTTKLSHEIEKFDGTTGELQAWVKIPTLSYSTDTVIYMYYGNSSCESQQSASSVWDCNYKMVQHLEETTETHYDSTSNDNDGTPYPSLDQGDVSITTCDSIDDWNGTSLSTDTSDKKEGTASLVDNVSSPTAGETYTTSYNPSGSWNLGTRNLDFWFKSDKADTAFTSARVYIYDTSGNWRYHDLTFSANTWKRFNLGITSGGTSSATPPSASAIDKVEWQFNAKDTTAFYKKIDIVYANGGVVQGETGQIDGADDFDGSNDYVDCGDNASLDIIGAITVETWTRPNTVAAADNWRALVYKQRSSSPKGGYGLLVDEDQNKVYFFTYGGGCHYVGPVDLTLNEWSHVVGTFDVIAGDNNDEMKIYIDGELKASGVAEGSYPWAIDLPLYIGGNPNDGISMFAPYEFNGIIDEVRVSDTARSADWIKTEYNNQSSPSDFYKIGNETPSTFTIVASAGSNGSISPSGSVTVEYGKDQTFTITPNTGYHILDVKVDGISVGKPNSYTFFNVTTNHTIHVEFEVDSTYFFDTKSGARIYIDLVTSLAPRWRVTIPSKRYDTGWMPFRRYTKTNNHFWGEYADTRYHFIIDFYSSGRYHIIFDDRVTRISIKIAN